MKVVKLENIAEVSAGQGAPQGDDSYSDNGLPFIKAGSLEDLIITNDEYKSCKLVNKETAKKYKLKSYPKDTLVFAKSGMSATKGRIYVLKNESYVVNHLATIIPNKLVEGSYLKYFFYIFPPSRLIKDESYPSIGLADINKIKIPLPILEDQKRIVKILDKANALHQKRKQAIDLLDDYLKSVFLEMFGDPLKNPKGWNKKSLGELTKVSSGSTPNRENKNYYGGSIPWVKTAEVNGRLILNTQEYITELGLKNSSCHLYPKESILIAMYGQGKTRGQVGLLGIGATTNQACGVMIPSPFYNTTYVFSILGYLYEDLRSLGRGGNQPNLNIGILQNYKIIFPPLGLQNKFSKIVEKHNILKQRMLSQSKEIETQFQALMQKAFKGDL